MDATPSPRAKLPWKLLLLLAGLRSWLVLNLADVFFYGEELEKGTAAKAMLDGLRVPHHQLAYHDYEGGGFVISHLEALAFLLVGENVLAHKLVALGFILAVGLAGWFLARRMFGVRAADLFLLLLALAPESFQKLSLISLGIHFEACLFALFVLGLGARLAAGKERSPREWLYLGLLTGFGLYFSYQLALAAAWVGLVLLVSRPRAVFGRGGGLGLAGTLLGALPLLYMAWHVGWDVFDIHGASVVGGEGPSKLQKLAAFLRSLYVDAPTGARLSAWAWTAAAALAIPISWKAGERRADRAQHRALSGAGYLLGYLGVFAVAYFGTDFMQGELLHFFMLLRLAPVWVVGTLLVSAALSRGLESPSAGWRWSALAASGLLLASGALATARAARGSAPEALGERWATLLETKGYSYDQYFAKVFDDFEGGPLERLEVVEAFEEPARRWLRADAVWNLFRDAGAGPSAIADEAVAVFMALPAERLEDYLFGLGAPLVVAGGWDPSRALELVEAQGGAQAALLVESIGRFGGGVHPLRPALDREVARGEGLGHSDAYWRGLGRWMYGRFRLSEGRAVAFFAPYAPRVRTALLEGYRAERAWHLWNPGPK